MERNAAKVVELDVRPHLRKKLEPFQLIMDTVKGLDQDDIFVLHATIKPTPLFGVLKMKGFAGKAEQAGKDHWVSTFVNKKNVHWLHGHVSGKEELADTESLPSDSSLSAENGPKSIALDNRGLEPPKPMIRTLAALERSRPGDEVIIHNDRVPMFLIEELRGLGYPYMVEEQPDGSAKVTIRKV
ncbi:DUF2249 domain-containing protein [Paenibacillus mesophilus]|uniref:DUF2249 domain-containing protein n=1 Tax=Paenibacillus mesophilus TaxID=2582849 RepID=UPI00110E6E93|nr:DUF2249 domain-containing protein [Paenibacillus mesophilus]TMV50345.1 DUF2249 domain-containing protein [Paenibacillus mesophilus]